MHVSVTVFVLTMLSCSSGTESKTSDSFEGKEATKQGVVEDSLMNLDSKVLALAMQDSIETCHITGYSVKKISGQHKYGGVTKVQYMNLQQVLQKLKADGEKQMETPEMMKEKVMAYKSTSLGGQIQLDVERITIGAADLKQFTIIVKDVEEKELFRKDLESSVPEYSSSNDNWWNLDLIQVGNKLPAHFFVYVIDRLEDAPFKFEVNATSK